MSDTALPDAASATLLFPQFEAELYNMIALEIEGLTEEQLNFESDRWEWSKWSIRRNLSHMASGDFRWFLVRWGDQLYPDGLPEITDLDNIINSPYDRRLNEDVYWDVDGIMDIMKQALGLAHSILSRETIASLRFKETKSGNRSYFHQAHPRGVRTDPEDSEQVYMSLEASFRHRYFEYITHLFNIQRLKRAQGLTATVQVPMEGYMALPDWDMSEP